MLSPIQTLRHHIHSVDFNPTNDVDRNIEAELEIFLESAEDDGKWHVMLGVKFGKKEGQSGIPYQGKIAMKGTFEVAEGFPEDKIEALVNMNGGAILYGAVRELFVLLSSRSEEGAFELPTLDAQFFIKIAAHCKKQRLENSSVED